MPNVDKIVKNVMHEISDGKVAVRETMDTALRNQDIIIAQNKRLIDLLEQINSKISLQRDASLSEAFPCNTSLNSTLAPEVDEEE